MDDTSHPSSDSLPPELYPNRAEVSLDSIRSNHAVMRRRAGGAAVMAVVKADAYGHGAVRVARALEADGVEHLAVAQLQEAVELRRAGIRLPILVMGVPRRSELPVYTDHGIDILVPSVAWARVVADHAGDSVPVSVHVKVDTGMHRLGMQPEDLAPALSILDGAGAVRLGGLWTHMAAADERDNPFTRTQYGVIKPLIDQFGQRFDRIHLAASHAVHFFPEVSGPGGRSLIRIGISLYGYLQDRVAADELGLRPAMRVLSRVAQIREVAPGETVSYNRRWTARRPSRIATVSCGYADGYFRALSNRASVGIGGARYPVAGTVCMDLIMVDLGPPGATDVSEGDEVVMFGDGGPSAYEVAEWAGTIVYEVCTNVSRRVVRTYE